MPPLRSAIYLVTFSSAVVLVLSGSGLRADDRDRLRVGRQADGRIVVPTNQVLLPAGRQLEFPGRPVDLLLVDAGRTLVVKNLRDLLFIDVAKQEVVQTLPAPVGFSVVGLAGQGDRIYATDAKDHLRIAVRQPGGRYAWSEPVALGKPAVGGSPHGAGIAVGQDGELWVASTRGNCIQRWQARARWCKRFRSVLHPTRSVFPDPSAATSATGAATRRRRASPGASSGTPVRVDPRTRHRQPRHRLRAGARTAARWKQVKTIAVGLHPSGLAASRDGRFVYVANANSDTVSVIDTRHRRGRRNHRLPARRRGCPSAAARNALALSPDGEHALRRQRHQQLRRRRPPRRRRPTAAGDARPRASRSRA